MFAGPVTFTLTVMDIQMFNLIICNKVTYPLYMLYYSAMYTKCFFNLSMYNY